MTVRVFHYYGEEYGGCVDLPDSCSVRTAVRSMTSRGWTEVPLDGVIGNGKAKMVREDYSAFVESVETTLILEEAHG